MNATEILFNESSFAFDASTIQIENGTAIPGPLSVNANVAGMDILIETVIIFGVINIALSAANMVLFMNLRRLQG